VLGQWAQQETAGTPTARTARRYRPRHLQPCLPGGNYLLRICKSEHVIFPLSSPEEGLWQEQSRQIFEAGSGAPAAPWSQLTPPGSLASAGHGEIKAAALAARIHPRQPPASHGELGVSSQREQPSDVRTAGTDGRCVSPRLPSPLHRRHDFGAGPADPGFHWDPCFSVKPQLSAGGGRGCCQLPDL